MNGREAGAQALIAGDPNSVKSQWVIGTAHIHNPQFKSWGDWAVGSDGIDVAGELIRGGRYATRVNHRGRVDWGLI